MKKMNSKGAMEMSVGTIVTIVLLMSVLVLGLYFVQKIFISAESALDLTDQQLQEKLQSLYSDDEDPLSLYPQTRLLEISTEGIDGIGVGIRNIERGGGALTFSYKVEAAGDDNQKNCGYTNAQLNNYIKQGSSEDGITLQSGGGTSRKVRLEIPPGAPLCLVRYKVTLMQGANIVASDYFDINVKA